MLRSPPHRNTSTPSRTPTRRTSPRSTGSAAPTHPPTQLRNRPTERDTSARGRPRASTPTSTAEAPAFDLLRRAPGAWSGHKPTPGDLLGAGADSYASGEVYRCLVRAVSDQPRRPRIPPSVSPPRTV